MTAPFQLRGDSPPLIEASAIEAGYGAGPAVLKKIDLSINEGEFIGVLGTNGCGKSTLIKVLTGFLPTRTGTIKLSGQPLKSIPRQQQARTVAVVSQANPALFPFRVSEAVSMGRYPFLKGFGLPAAADRDRIHEAMVQADVVHLKDRAIDELSGGEAQRVLLARALAQRSRVLLLDEPNTHLDLKHRIAIFTLLRRLCHSEQLGVLCVLHDLNLAAEFCSRVVLLGDGNLIADGPPADVLTSDNLEQTFGVAVPVVPNPFTGRPMIAWHREDEL